MPASPGANSADRKPIEKKIVHAGTPGKTTPELRDGTRVRFHFAVKDMEGVTLDDSRKWDHTPSRGAMELVMGKKFKLECWETCLTTMSIGEVASFTIKKQLLHSYPTVAKKLRDSFDPRRHKLTGGKAANGPHQHMCGMMAMQMQGGLGYDDLNKLLKEPSDLEFIFEVLSVELPEEYEKESWQMDPKEKLGSIPELKEEGNNLYKSGKTKEAAEKYFQALGMLEQLMLREKPNDTEWLSLRSAKIPILLNFAQCKLTQKEYYPVIEHCTEVLEADPDNVKALFRRGKAHIGAWNPADAKADLSRVAELDPSLEAACRKEIKAVEAMEKQKDEADKEKLKKCFE